MPIELTLDAAASVFENETPGVNFPDIKEVDLSQVGLNAQVSDVIGRSFFMDVNLYSAKLNENWRLPNEPLIRFSKRKKIAETIMAGNDENEGGIVYEQINRGYYSIQLRGLLQDANREVLKYPAAQMEKLISFCESSEPIDIDCELLELARIRKMVITSFAFGDMKGKPYSQQYVINAKSYIDFYAELNLNN